jgi:hypothetical protein
VDEPPNRIWKIGDQMNINKAMAFATLVGGGCWLLTYDCFTGFWLLVAAGWVYFN